jgi:glucokinase
MSKLGLGVDVGATKTMFGVFDTENGAIHSLQEMLTAVSRGGVDFADRLVRELQALHRRYAIGNQGLAIPELISLNHRPASQYLWDWEALDLPTRLGPLPLVYESDVIAAARAENRFGPFRGKTFLYVSLGTGISSCLVVDGQVYRGSRGFAIHCGHMPLRVPGHPEGVVLEDLVSGSGLLRAVEKVVPGLCATTEQVFEYYRKRHPQVRQTVDQAAALLGSWLGQLVNTLDPQAVVLGGGLATATEYFQAIEVNLRAAIWSPLVRDLPIRPACFTRMTGVLGAALPIESK